MADNGAMSAAERAKLAGKPSLQKLAAAVCKNSRAKILHHPRAILEPERNRRKLKIAELENEYKNAAAKLAGDTLAAALNFLETSAAFVVDVRGDNPSIPQLETALSEYRGLRALKIRRFEISRELAELRAGLHRYRWEAVIYDGIAHSMPLFAADTERELRAAMESAAARSADQNRANESGETLSALSAG